MARALALNGAKKVFVIGRRADSLQTTVLSAPGIIVPLVGDVTSKDSLAECAKLVKAEEPYIDVLIANAGVLGPIVDTMDAKTQESLPIEQVISNMWAPTTEAVTSTYAVNLTAIHFTVAAFLPLLHAANLQRPPPMAGNFRPRPQIITTASIGGFNRLPLGSMSYGPSKAGVIHMTKMMASWLIPYDIRANSIAPGLYLSEMTAPMYTAQGKTAIHNVEGTFPKKLVPATRTGDEQDMAGVILWLCSRAGAYINGNVVVTDGGRLAAIPSSY
jgi:NAD(P)-dependent dehydrogenase (short-subunit alcohol dehydrogenase family)